MGYYVTLTHTNAILPAANLDAAHTALCALNERNDLKRGGSGAYAFGRTPEGEDPIEGPHDKVWFSWMDWNYPETCPDVAAVLTQLGFEFGTGDDGSIEFFAYDNKTGAEEHFIAALAPYLTSSDNNPPQFVWRGEDGALWRQVVLDGRAVEQQGKVTFV